MRPRESFLAAAICVVLFPAIGGAELLQDPLRGVSGSIGLRFGTQ